MAEIASFGVDVDENTKLAQNAQDTANDANKKNSANSQQIANINDPNYLTPFEKPQLEIQMDNFATIYAADKDIATSEGIDFTAYDAAYQAYLTYMTPLVADMTTYSPIVRSTFNSMVASVQVEQKRFSTATQAQYNQQIKQAQTDIDDGQTKYKALQSEAETMKSSVAGISDVADRAISSAGFASNAASTASQAANEASQTASSALAGATSAQSDASSAVAAAQSTASEFGKVSQKTDSAVASALNAQSAASDAVAQAASAAADSKDAKQIAGAVSQSYQTLTDGSTMTIAELESGLAVKLTKSDLDGYATETWAQNQIKVSADGINGTISSIKSTVDGQTTIINDLKADSGSFKSQFTTVNDTLGKHTTDIGSLQTSSKELTSGFNTLTSDNTTNKNDISQLKQTATEVSSTLETVQTQVQNSAVGTNLAVGTGQEYVMGYGIPNTTWKDGYAYLKLPTTVYGTGEILPQEPYSFWYTLDQGVTYTQTIWFETDATVKDLNAAQITWYTGVGHDFQPVRVQKLGQNSYKIYSAYTWPGKSSNNVRLFDIQHLDSAFDLSTGTYLKFGKLKLEKGGLSTDWCLNPAETATVTAMSKVSQTVDGMKADISKKIEQKDLNGYATQTWAQNQINTTANGINATVSSVKTTVDGHTTSINDLKADSSSFKAQFTTVNGTLSTQSTDIGVLQASSKELSSNFSSLNTDNGTNKNDISKLQQTAEAFNSTLTTVQTQVQNSAVGTNLLLGTGNNLTIAGTNTVNQAGYGYSLANGYNVLSLTSAFGTQFTLSFDWSVSGSSPSGTFMVQYNGTPWTQTPSVTVSSSNTSGHVSSPFNANTNSQNVATTLGLRLDNFVGTITISNVKLEKGSLATDYSANPADNATVTALTQVKQTAEGAQVLATNNQSDIAKLQVTAKGLQSTVSDKADQSQITQLSNLIQNKVSSSDFDNLSKNVELQTLDSADINNIKTNGHYFVHNLANTPVQGWVYVDVIGNGNDRIRQDVYQDTNNQHYYRRWFESSWMGWSQGATESEITQLSDDINLRVKKGDVVNQFNLDAGGALLQTSGANTKIVLSAPNIIFDTANPVQIPSANIEGTLTGKTIEASYINSTTNITGSDIEAPIIHSPDNSFILNGATGDIVGSSIHAADNSWGISKAGKVTGASITASVMDISGDGGGPDFDNIDNNGVTPDTAEGIYSRYKYTVDAGYDTGGMHRKLYKNGFLVINGDTFLDRAIGDWSADGGSKYVYDTMYEAHTIKMRAYAYTGNNVQTDDPTKTQGSLSDRLDITPKAITMGTNWSTDSPSTRITSDGGAKFGNFYFNSGHTMQSMDGGAIYLESQNNGMVDLHVQKLYQSSLLSLKTDITDIDPHDALNTIVGTDVKSYHFKTDDTNEPKSVSPILDDINPIPKYNTPDIFKSADGKSRSDGNIVGYLMLSVKDLNSRLQKLEGAS